MLNVDRYISRPEAEVILQVSRNTIKRYIREGIIQAERLPTPGGLGPWRISESSVLAILEGPLKQQALAHLRGLRL